MTMLSTLPSSPTTPFTRKRVLFLAARLRRIVNNYVAAVIASHERRAALAALRQLGDRELKDIGLYRGQVEEAIERAAQQRLRRLGRL